MIKAFIVMLQFFTRIPINIQIDLKKDTLAKGTFYFPIVGMIIGGISALVYYLLSFVNRDIAALGAVFAIIAVTGGIHVDGLSDTADGFFSARSRERILEIMKDSRVGTFGVIAIIFDILSKLFIIRAISPETVIISIILSCGAGRLASAMLFTFGKTARPGGMGDMFTGNNGKVYFGLGAVFFLAVGYFLGGLAFLAAAGVVMIFAILFMRYSYKVIGGLTGDVYGACCELGEIISLFVFLAVSLWI